MSTERFYMQIPIDGCVKSGIRIETYSSLCPWVFEQELDRVDEEEDVDNDKEMVGVPKGIEPCEAMERPWKLH